MTRRPCLSAAALAELIRGNGTENDERHVSQCATCERRASLLRRIVSAGVDPIADSAAEVDDLIARLWTAQRVTWWKVVREPEYQRADVARRLLTLAVEARLRDCGLAVDFAKATTAIVDVLARRARDVADLRFEAWKFSSAILREAGRYAETGAAFVNAEDAAQAASDPELAQASILLSRALFCAEPDIWKPEEAEALLDRAERVFARRDEDRMLSALTTRALLLFRSGDLSAARQRFECVLEHTPKTDREKYLNALSNLIWVRVELREADAEVEQALEFLIKENVALGRAVQVARGRWMMGRVNSFRGIYDIAVDFLRSAMTGIGDSDSSIRIGLDTIETLLLADRHPDAFGLARELASVTVALDEREPNRRRALTAQVFAYLHEAARRETLTADLVAGVARYVDRITRQPPFDFIPPMLLADM